jgi:hypothetical protein
MCFQLFASADAAIWNVRIVDPPAELTTVDSLNNEGKASTKGM